jgi:hypothetical protein
MATVPMFVPACGEREKIIAETQKVIHSITEIYIGELESAIAGNLVHGDESIDLRLKELRELKTLLMERLSRQCAEHGCAGQ